MLIHYTCNTKIMYFPYLSFMQKEQNLRVLVSSKKRKMEITQTVVSLIKKIAFKTCSLKCISFHCKKNLYCLLYWDEDYWVFFALFYQIKS